ncbi:MAG: NADPH:quinone reductase [Armatimonadetes bacterium]|nr:NADPH:quinone reductase [Armatimonadota bacterium]
MKAAVYRQFGAAEDVLTLESLPDPTPGEGEVLVRVRTSGVNPSDVKSRQGLFKRSKVFDLIVPQSDGSGVVEAIGSGVGRWQPGDRVFIFNAQWQRALGTAAELCVIPEDLLAPLPEDVSFEAGATLGIPLMTACEAVFAGNPDSKIVSDSLRGKTVLVSGGAGAVGCYAIQMAKWGGAQVLSTVSTDEKAAIARNAGADVTINYKQEDVAARVLELTSGEGVDRAIEVNLGQNLTICSRVVKPHGVILVYGSDDAQTLLPVHHLLMKAVLMQFILVYILTPDERMRVLNAIAAFLSDGAFRPHIARTFTLEEIVEAHKLQESGKAIGNIVLKVS